MCCLLLVHLPALCREVPRLHAHSMTAGALDLSLDSCSRVELTGHASCRVSVVIDIRFVLMSK